MSQYQMRIGPTTPTIYSVPDKLAVPYSFFMFFHLFVQRQFISLDLYRAIDRPPSRRCRDSISRGKTLSDGDIL